MSRFPSLRRALVAAVAAAGVTACPCPPPLLEGEQRVAIDHESFAAELETCLASDAACLELCRAILVKQGFVAEEDHVVFEHCVLDLATEDTYVVAMRYSVPDDCSSGRRPPGLRAARAAAAASMVGAWLADVASLEAASIYAFARLAAELRALGAPEVLVARAVAAANDERRHAAATLTLARRWGADPTLPEIEPTPPRDLAELARDNAAEGCVGELYGAAVALHQAARAADPSIRAAMRVIAAEEASHAELSLAIDRWARGRLGDGERRAVEAARRAAASALLGRAGATDPGGRAGAARRVLGLPDGAGARALATALFGARVRSGHVSSRP